MEPEKKKRGGHIGLTETEDYICIEDLKNSDYASAMDPISLDYYGSEQCRKGYAFGPFVRSSYVLHMVTEGRGQFRKEGHCWQIMAGEAFLIRPGERTIYQADPEEPWAYMWIGFHGFRADQMMRRIGFTEKTPVISCQDMPRLSGIMEELLAARDLSYINELKRTSALYQLLAVLTEQNHLATEEQPRLRQDQSYVQTAVNLLIGSRSGQIRISDVARTIGISRNYLTTIFRQELGVSPQEYLMNYRMEKAGSLLRVTGDPVSVIAAEVGYHDPLAFSKNFRRRYGMSPTEYRGAKSSLTEHSNKGDYISENPL